LIGTPACTFWWDDRQMANNHFKILFFKIVRSQKKFFLLGHSIRNSIFQFSPCIGSN
jgi:hypothetical protein